MDRALSLRGTFDEDPDRYDRARPGYPAGRFDDLAALAGLRPGDRVLEVGPGTGQATVALAERGYAVVAVELGAGLAAVARRKLAAAGRRALAVVTTWHVAGGDEAFFAGVQECYERFMPGTPPGLRLPPAADMRSEREAVEPGARFERGIVRRYERDIEYTTAGYIDLLRTYSGHRSLARTPATHCCGASRGSSTEHHGGRIAKGYLNELVVVYRVP